MNWYIGSVNEAIKHCLEQKALLIVYVHHPDAESNSKTAQFNVLWEKFDKSCLERLNYVALKLTNDSEGFKMFSDIYPTPVIPACYLIGLGGKPLEIVTSVEEVTVDQLNSLVRNASELYEQQFMEFLSKPESPQKANDSNDAATAATDKGPQHDNEGKELTMEEKLAIASGAQTNSQGNELTLEEKVAIARQKITEKRKLDDEKKKQEEHEKEMRRIKEGKLMQEARERAKENEIREAAEERRRQKIADQEHLRRLREQIKADKEARAQKTGGAPQEENKPSTAAEPVINKPIATDECRIQCRFPDGSNLVKQFKSDSPLQYVVDAVKDDGRHPGDFFIVQTYPRKQFMIDEYKKSFLELGLTPSAALLIVSGCLPSGNSGIIPAVGGYLSFFLGILYSPLIAIYQFVNSFIGFRQRQSDPSGFNGPPNRRMFREPGSSSNDIENLRRRHTKKDENSEGNMARLRNQDDSDDENATWNGNSTQQL